MPGCDYEIEVGVLPRSPMPVLLSLQVLKDLKLKADFNNNTFTCPSLEEQGQALKVKTAESGHLLLPLTSQAWKEDLWQDECWMNKDDEAADLTHLGKEEVIKPPDLSLE